MTSEKPSFKNDLAKGKVTINYNGHICTLDDYTYERRLRGFSFYDEIGGQHKCYLCGKEVAFLIDKELSKPDKIHFKTVTWKYGKYEKTIYNTKCTFKKKEIQEGAFKIQIPTGNLIIANYFLNDKEDYIFDVPEEKKWSSKYDICNIKGQNNRAEYVSKKFNVGYVQINSEIQVWKSNDNNKIFFLLNYDDYSEASKEEHEFNKNFDNSNTFVTTLRQRVWRYEFADESIIEESGAKISEENEHVELSVTPGQYIVKHHYGKTYFKINKRIYTIVTEIEKANPTRQIIFEKHG